ncbi:hypothetical protein ETD83_33270 [Actinomadura soli]|uniref:Uncharacterized protein n=1 Tax=Actinomadura soli TaxID=2508997 RepID=A0A5C4J2F6_9ACTN|nr:hypothetical protein ETD83_33270 [Actinomadura soli]
MTRLGRQPQLDRHPLAHRTLPGRSFLGHDLHQPLILGGQLGHPGNLAAVRYHQSRRPPTLLLALHLLGLGTAQALIGFGQQLG